MLSSEFLVKVIRDCIYMYHKCCCWCHEWTSVYHRAAVCL